MKHSSGTKRKLNIEQEEKIVEIVTTKTLDQVGFKGGKNWVIEFITQWVMSEFNVTMCHSVMSIVLHRLNLSCTIPTYVLAKADKVKQENFKNDFKILKKHLKGEVDHILFEDESMIRAYQSIKKI